VLGQVGQLLGRDGDADTLEFGFQLRQLVRLPLALVGVGGGDDPDGRDDGQDDGFEPGGPQDE
jgi:hypothetical protein